MFSGTLRFRSSYRVCVKVKLRNARWAALPVVGALLCAQQAPTIPLVIRDITIIDCTGHAAQPGMSLLISNGRIAAIGPVARVKVPANAEIIDGRGKYLIPGLWNMHVHLGTYSEGKLALSAFLAQGVTGLRDMGSPLDDILRLRQEVNDGTIQGPEMVVSGPLIQGPLPFQMPVFISVKDVAAARATVDMLHQRGVDFIKVQDAIPHDIYVAVATQARHDRIPFVGHIPPTVLPEEASDLGQRSIEHLGGRFWGVLIGSSTEESKLHAQEVQMYKDILTALGNNGTPPTTNMRAEFTRAIVESYDAQKAAALIRRFQRNGTWQCPTLVVLHTLWADSAAKYTSEDLRWADRLLARDTEIVDMMQRAGVRLLAGTDLPPGARKGSIHDELADLVDAGLTPMQALETATRNAAEFLGKRDTVGTVERNKAADLVLLNANPLDDIHNTARISAVIVHGRVVSH
jgi:imidazolonepropionase-like amidohydrolase